MVLRLVSSVPRKWGSRIGNWSLPAERAFHNSHFPLFFVIFHVLWGVSWSPQAPPVQITKPWEVLGPCFLILLEDGISIPTVLRFRADQIFPERFHMEHVLHPNLRIMESFRLENNLKIIKFSYPALSIHSLPISLNPTSQWL